MSQENEKKVSVIIPAYNTEKYICDCIDSVSNQTYKNIEILVVNDGSVDKTESIVKEKMNKDTRIKLLTQKNSGVNIARKKGLDNSTGDYIMFLDSDDWIDVDTIEKLLKKISDKNVDVIKFSMIYEPTKKRKIITDISELFVEKEDYSRLYDMLLNTYKLNSICATLVKKSLFNNNFNSFNTSILFAEDFMINIDLVNYSNNMLLLNAPYYHYRINPKSTTKIKNVNRIINNTKNAFYAYSKLINYIDKWNLNEEKVKFKIFKETCVEMSKLSMCQELSREQEKKIMIDLLNDIHLYETIKGLTRKGLNDSIKKMSKKDKVLYKRYLKSIYERNYRKSINSLLLLSLKSFIKK